jgi:hypothetical protein
MALWQTFNHLWPLGKKIKTTIAPCSRAMLDGFFESRELAIFTSGWIKTAKTRLFVWLLLDHTI